MTHLGHVTNDSSGHVTNDSSSHVTDPIYHDIEYWRDIDLTVDPDCTSLHCIDFGNESTYVNYSSVLEPRRS